MQNVLYIFKDLPWYHSYILNKFSCSYYFNEYIINNNLNKTSQGISEEINSLIKEKKIEIIFFDFDYTSIIDKFFVNKIICKKKILVSFDPHENYKKIQDSLEYFSHLLIADPEYVEKLSLLNQNCFHFPLEANEKIFFNKKTKKKY